MTMRDEALKANEQYASGFGQGNLPMPPAKHLAAVVCMDARLMPDQFLGLGTGDAHIIRNAGGIVTDDALRSLIISHKLLGTNEFFVINHTDCGMLTFTNDQLRNILRNDLNADASGIDFLPFSDLDESVRHDVQTIRSSPLIPDDISVSGFVFDVKTGRLREVH